jgi:hypothetical protein
MSSHNQFQQAAQAAQEAKARGKAAEEAAEAAAEAAALSAAPQVYVQAALPPPVKLSLWQRILNKGGSFLFLSIVFHLLLLAGAATYVVQSIHSKEKLKFTSNPTLGAPGQKSLEYKVQTAKRNQSMSSAPAASTRLTSSASNVKVAIPDAPLTNSSSSAMPSIMGGMGGSSFGASGGGGGVGGIAVPGAMAAMPAAGFTVFGFKGSGVGRGLSGRLYDLKQDKDKKPTEGDGNDKSYVLRYLRNFDEKRFDMKLLQPFFVSPVELMATRFWVPNGPASQMPQAFNVEKDVKPTSLLIHYKGKVSPPKDGKYRFVGFGDDFLGIKLNGKVILPFDRPGSRIYGTDATVTGAFYANTKKGHAVSDPVLLRAGQPVDLEIILVEWPGGLMTFSLLVEREEDLRDGKYKKTPNGLPILPIFETDITAAIPEYEDKPGTPTLLPPRDPNRMLWKVLRE